MAAYLPEGSLIGTEENSYYLKNVTTLQEAMQNKMSLEARAIVCDSEHNLIVDLGIMKGIIPKEECAIGIREGTTRDIAIISIAIIKKRVTLGSGCITESGDE